jgi:Lrp/AsnC family leucine-responsive transcriptional regulator
MASTDRTNVPPDDTDLAILQALEQDGRLSFSDLAEKVGLSKTPCWQRVQALERRGLIRGYRAVVDPAALGVGLNAFIQVTIDLGQHEAFEAAAIAHPAVIQCHTTAGEGDYLVHVVTSDVGALDELLRRQIRQLPGVVRLSTTVCLKTIKEGALLTRATGRGRLAKTQ